MKKISLFFKLQELTRLDLELLESSLLLQNTSQEKEYLSVSGEETSKGLLKRIKALLWVHDELFIPTDLDLTPDELEVLSVALAELLNDSSHQEHVRSLLGMIDPELLSNPSLFL